MKQRPTNRGPETDSEQCWKRAGVVLGRVGPFGPFGPFDPFDPFGWAIRANRAILRDVLYVPLTTSTSDWPNPGGPGRSRPWWLLTGPARLFQAMHVPRPGSRLPAAGLMAPVSNTGTTSKQSDHHLAFECRSTRRRSLTSMSTVTPPGPCWAGIGGLVGPQTVGPGP